MRGRSQDQGRMFSYIHPEKRIPAYHPLRKIRELVREVLKELNHTFGRLYSHEGRPSIPPEQLLSALILQVLYSVRSERQLMEQLDYNLLFRWFVGLSPDDPIWDPTVFTKNRERLQEGDVFQKFMTRLLKHEKVKPLLSDEHFSVDGTLIEAWASHKSFKPKQAKTDDDGSNFHGQLRKNDTHQSTTDPKAKLYRKADGREAKLSYLGHALMENRNGLAVGGMVTQADGTAERRASDAMLKKQAKGSKRITVGEDKAYDTSDHIAALRRMNVTPHVAQNDSLTKTGKRRRSAIDARTTRHIGYQISQTCRKMAECIFGWGKQHGTMRKTKHRGIAAVAADFMLNLIAYNLVAHSQAHRRLRRSLPASRKTGSDRPKSNNKGRKRLGYRRFFSELLKDYFRRGAHWTAAPRPQLTDELFDPGFRLPEKGEPISYILTEFEPVFDAAV